MPSSTLFRTLAEPPTKVVKLVLPDSLPLNNLATPPVPIVMVGVPLTLMSPPVMVPGVELFPALIMIASAEVLSV